MMNTEAVRNLREQIKAIKELPRAVGTLDQAARYVEANFPGESWWVSFNGKEYQAQIGKMVQFRMAADMPEKALTLVVLSRKLHMLEAKG